MPLPSDTAHRLFHRQMYIDIIRSHLPRLGTQRDLARSLGLSEVYLSFLLREVADSTHWSGMAAYPRESLRDLLADLKTPSDERAIQIADTLHLSPAQRELFVQHVRGAAGADAGLVQHAADCPVEPGAAIRELRQLARAADSSADLAQVREARTAIWQLGHELLELLDARTHHLAYADVLLVLRSAATVFNRPEVALGYARQALLLLQSWTPPAGEREACEQMVARAFLGEAIALNDLGLPRSALATVAVMERLPGVHADYARWFPSLAMQELHALRQLPRFSVYAAEALASRARRYTGQGSSSALRITNYHLAQVYLAQGSTRSLRKAAVLVDEALREMARGDMNPLVRALLLLTCAWYFAATHEKKLQREQVARCLAVALPAGLLREAAKLERDHGGSLSPTETATVSRLQLVPA